MVLLRYLKGVPLLPVSCFETKTPPRSPGTAFGAIFPHSSFLLLPSVGQSTCGAPRWTRATLVFTKSWQPVSRPHWESRGLDHLVQATAIHASRCAWLSVRQRLETALKAPRIAHCAGLRGLNGTNAGYEYWQKRLRCQTMPPHFPDFGISKVFITELLARLYRGQGFRLATTRSCKRQPNLKITQLGPDFKIPLVDFGESAAR